MQKLIDEYLEVLGQFLAIKGEYTALLKKSDWVSKVDGKTLASIQRREREAWKLVQEVMKKIHDALDGRFYVMPSGEILVAFMDSEDGPEIQLLKEYKDEAK